MESQINYFNNSWESTRDGPGIRVVLFLQGCHLDCPWCHSAHSRPVQPALLFFEHLCLNCGICSQACPNKAHAMVNGRHILHGNKCIQCGDCIRQCPLSRINRNTATGPLRNLKFSSSPEKLFEYLIPQLELWRKVGGLTISGGEPPLQYQALGQILELCQKAGINVD